MKIKKSTWLPIILLIYLAVMSVIGWKGYQSGQNSALYYFGSIAVTLGIIYLLHLRLKKREKLRAEREQELKDNSSKN